MRDRAFTLVELLVAISVVAVIMGMLLSLLGVAQRSARKQATLAVMGKTDAALRMFRTEMLVYPWQGSYPSDPNDTGFAWTNRLHWAVGTDIDTVSAANLRADMATARAQYAYPVDGGGNPVMPFASAHVIRSSDMRPLSWYWDGGSASWQPRYPGEGWTQVWMLNRIAAERAGLVMLSGACDSGGLRILPATNPNTGAVIAGRDCSGIPLVATPQSASRPGWAGDYLHGEIERRFVDGDSLLDAWGRPLVYICQVKPGMRAAAGMYNGTRMISLSDLSPYGLDVSGRTTLVQADAATGQPLPADPVHLPDPGDLLGSDRTRYAAPGYDQEFELWSAGPDGSFAAMRRSPVNHDNIPAGPYDKGLR